MALRVTTPTHHTNQVGHHSLLTAVYIWRCVSQHQHTTPQGWISFSTPGTRSTLKMQASVQTNKRQQNKHRNDNKTNNPNNRVLRYRTTYFSLTLSPLCPPTIYNAMLHICSCTTAAMGNPSVDDAPWGIVSIKPQDVNVELPMAYVNRKTLPTRESARGH